MRDAILFGTAVSPDGKKSLHGLKARVAAPIGPIPDVIIHNAKLYVFHYEGAGELYYREASVYHFQKNAVMVDGIEINQGGNDALLSDHRRGKEP